MYLYYSPYKQTVTQLRNSYQMTPSLSSPFSNEFTVIRFRYFKAKWLKTCVHKASLVATEEELNYRRFYTLLHTSTHYYTLLHIITLYYTSLHIITHYTSLHHIRLYYTLLHIIMLYYDLLYTFLIFFCVFSALHFILVYYTLLRFISWVFEND